MRILTPADKQHIGKISISRISSNVSNPTIHLELTDTTSGCILVDITVPLAEFSLALTGLGYQPCTFEYYADCPVGKRREVKTEVVVVPRFDRKDEKHYIKPFEVDGWMGCTADIGNRNNYVAVPEEDTDGYRVSFVRFV